MAASELIGRLRRELSKAGDPARAKAQQAYMKTTERYHGVTSGEVRAIGKSVFADHAIDDAATWQRDVLAIWRGAKFREERYCAIALAGDRRARAFQTMHALPMYEEIIVSGAWWDIVDAVATNHLTQILENDTKKMRAAMLRWSKDPDMWKQRSSIICQVPRKEETDLELLYACIEPSIGRKEFWLRKAIGWALRQYAWTDGPEIVRYVKANEARLSGLSIREALKNITSKGTCRPRGSRARRPSPSS